MLQFASEGKLSIEDVVRLTSENPARNYGIQNKGFIKEGYDADLVVIDPKKEEMITNDMVLSKCGWTPYEGMPLKGGVVEKTFVNGSLIYNEGKIVSENKGGKIAVKKSKSIE